MTHFVAFVNIKPKFMKYKQQKSNFWFVAMEIEIEKHTKLFRSLSISAKYEISV